MAETVSTYILEGPRAAEMYITVAPPAGAAADEQLAEMFALASDVLRREGAKVFQERAFVAADVVDRVPAARAAAYGDVAADTSPAVLLGPAGRTGLQIHAIRCDDAGEALGGLAPLGRIFRIGDLGQLALSGLVADAAAPPGDQARIICEQAEALLATAGADFHAVPRTWWWLGDILIWYDDFNAVRNDFFSARELTGSESRPARMPASTGIGVRPPGGAACALDLVAVTGGGQIEHHNAAGRQNSAFAYGSAFSRSARATTAGGQTVWVSGTAAIDASGRTLHIDDARRQIENTCGNVRAVLAENDCGDGDVVAAIAYCKTLEVEAIWREMQAGLDWPFVTVIADVCRDDLLFEVEATACPGVRRL